MIGYMANYVLPRAGEIARCTYVSAKHKTSFSALFGTVAVERIIDIFVLGLGLLLTASLLRERFQVISNELSIPSIPWLLIVSGSLVTSIAVYFGFQFKSSSAMRERLLGWFRKFIDGLKTIYQTPLRRRLIWTTLLIWLLYALMAYIPLLMFELDGGLSYWDAIAIMFIGALGIAVPTPGGAGSFHFLTILTLTGLYGIDQSGASAYAVFVHGSQLILYLTAGGLILSLFSFNTNKKSSKIVDP